MIKVTLLSYDAHWNTYEVEVHPYRIGGGLCAEDHKVRSLVPEILIPYLSSELYQKLKDNQFRSNVIVGESFNMVGKF
jgi:hypothetical protein